MEVPENILFVVSLQRKNTKDGLQHTQNTARPCKEISHPSDRLFLHLTGSAFFDAMEINFLKQFNAFFQKADEVKLTPSAKLLYICLFQLWNKCGFKSEFNVPYMVAMEITGFASFQTYYRLLRELQDKGYVKWIPSKNQHLASKIEFILLYDSNQSNLKGSDKSNDKSNRSIPKQSKRSEQDKLNQNKYTHSGFLSFLKSEGYESIYTHERQITDHDFVTLLEKGLITEKPDGKGYFISDELDDILKQMSRKKLDQFYSVRSAIHAFIDNDKSETY